MGMRTWPGDVRSLSFPLLIFNTDCYLLADPKLTALGIRQAQVVNKAWNAEIEYDIPLPQSLYSSPFTRALHTASITFDGILFDSKNNGYVKGHKLPFIKEVRSFFKI